MIFDTHCHLGYGSKADGDVPDDARADWARARAAAVTRAIDVGIDLASSRGARVRAAALDGLHYSAGLHPNHADAFDAEWSDLAAMCRAEDCVAVGETGMDFFREHTTPAQQAKSFEHHLQLARDLDKPVIVHCRDAFEATFAAIQVVPDVRGVMHCFSGGVPEAEQALELGFYLSFAGPLTYKKSDALRAAAAEAPADRILVETDAPFLPPQSRRGKRNEPALVVETLTKLAELRGMSFDAAARATTANAQQLFGVA